ncbi:MAG: YlxR family protein [Clostridia bacterium]|nr:YlxR family protein [Clostridia bacterium]
MEQANKPKKIPTRQCLGCNEHKPKKELLRVVRDPEGQVSLDFTGKKSGRGAYICHSLKCLKKARKSRRLEKSLECEIPESVFDHMEEELEADE